MRIVLDTNILARAASGPPGLAHELVLAATRPEHVLLLSPFLLSELSRVLRYDRLRSIHGFNDVEIDEFIADLQLVAEIVVPPGPPPTVVAADPDDDPVVATAVTGGADILCTRDRHLLSATVVTYCLSYGVVVLDDRETLRRLRSA